MLAIYVVHVCLLQPEQGQHPWIAEGFNFNVNLNAYTQIVAAILTDRAALDSSLRVPVTGEPRQSP